VPHRRRAVAVLVVVALGVLAIDQVSKALALGHLAEGERTDLLGSWFGLQLMRNPGAALSFATGMTWVFTLAAIGVVVVVVRVADRLASRAWALSLGLLLGGAVGNLGDRLFRAPGFAVGHVVDFLAYGSLFIGNVADIAIVVAACLIVLLTVRGITLDGARPTDEGGDEAAEDAGPDDGSEPSAAPPGADEDGPAHRAEASGAPSA
jgi:signal peptidase II